MDDAPDWYAHESFAHLQCSLSGKASSGRQASWRRLWRHEKSIHANTEFGFCPVMLFAGWMVIDTPHDGNCCPAAVRSFLKQHRIYIDCPSVLQLRESSAEMVKAWFFPKECQPTISDDEREMLFYGLQLYVESLLEENLVKVKSGITLDMALTDLTVEQVCLVCDQFASSTIDFEGLFVRALATFLDIHLMILSFLPPNAKMADALWSTSIRPVGLTNVLATLPLVLIGHVENDASRTEHTHFVQLQAIPKGMVDQWFPGSKTKIDPDDKGGVAIAFGLPLWQRISPNLEDAAGYVARAHQVCINLEDQEGPGDPGEQGLAECD